MRDDDERAVSVAGRVLTGLRLGVVRSSRRLRIGIPLAAVTFGVAVTVMSLVESTRL